eukprot:scaffold24658_cov41-Prasinocladus_malaysianus.AAC.1
MAMVPPLKAALFVPGLNFTLPVMMHGKVLKGINGYDAKALSGLVWSFATVNREAQELFDVAGPIITRGAGGLTTREISNAAWAYARMRRPNPELMDALAGEALAKASWFHPVEVRDFVQSLAKMRRP